MTAVARRRRAIEGPLSDLHVSNWVTPDEWIRYMRATNNTFEVSHEPWRLYITDPNYGSLNFSGATLWHILNKRYLLALLYEGLATMGMIDLAYVYPNEVPRDYSGLWGTDDLPYLSRYDGLLRFRLNHLGGYILGKTRTYAPAIPVSGSRLVYRGEGVAEDPDNSLLPADRLQLERLAKTADDGAHWEITIETLASAVESGLEIRVIRPFLETLFEKLPEDIDFLLSDLEEGANRIASLGQGTILRLRDGDLAGKLASDPSLSKWVLQAGGNHIVVLPGKEASVRRRLKKLGFVLPADTL